MGNQQCNRHLHFPCQHYSFQWVFQTFPYLWSFPRLFRALKISTLNSRTFHTFPGSVRTSMTTIIAQMLSIGGKGANTEWKNEWVSHILTTMEQRSSPWRQTSTAGALLNCEWWLEIHSSCTSSSVSPPACQSPAYLPSTSRSVNRPVPGSAWTGAAGGRWTEWLKLSVVARDDPDADDFRLPDWNRAFDASP